jgi:hypothetical protein
MNRQRKNASAIRFPPLASVAAAALALLVGGCDGRPTADDVSDALQDQIREDVRSHAPMLWDRSGRARAIEPSLVRVRDLEIDYAAFITDYWSVSATFVLDLGYTTQDQRVQIRLAETAEGAWEIRQLVQR